MKKYILYVGLNDKDTKKQEMPTDEALTLINELVYNLCDGATVYAGKGIYKHDNGEKVNENTIIIELLNTNITTVKNIAEESKKALNQESVMLQAIDLNYIFC